MPADVCLCRSCQVEDFIPLFGRGALLMNWEVGVCVPSDLGCCVHCSAQPSPSVYSPLISTAAGTRLRGLVRAKSLLHYGISEMPITMQFLNACLLKDDV